jgi:hypothetical protein
MSYLIILQNENFKSHQANENVYIKFLVLASSFALIYFAEE